MYDEPIMPWGDLREAYGPPSGERRHKGKWVESIDTSGEEVKGQNDIPENVLLEATPETARSTRDEGAGTVEQIKENMQPPSQQALDRERAGCA